MVDAERIKELEKLDKRLKARRKLTVAFFAILSVVLVLYAVNIERKIDRLSEGPAVVVYSETSEEDAAEEKGNDDISDVVPGGADIASAENKPDADDLHKNTFEEDKQLSDSGQVYYVTTSGKKYHKIGCNYLTKSKREVTYDEIMSGGYTACSRCLKE